MGKWGWVGKGRMGMQTEACRKGAWCIGCEGREDGIQQMDAMSGKRSGRVMVLEICKLERRK